MVTATMAEAVVEVVVRVQGVRMAEVWYRKTLEAAMSVTTRALGSVVVTLTDVRGR